MLLIAVYGIALAWAVFAQLLPWLLLPVLAVVSVLTFLVYWRDKSAATKGNWRTSESTLHLWSLAGGWPGAWAAHRVLRHKSSKRSFRTTYWATVAMHCAAVGGWVCWAQMGG